MSETRTIGFVLNGTTHRLDVPVNLVLADLIRDAFFLTGCKVACDQGVCGACTVLVDDVPTASCGTFAFEIDGTSVETVEGLSGADGRLSALQREFLEGDAYQCGFCTAGMILSVKALLRWHADPDNATVKQFLSANTCRCTGYQAILQAALRAVAAARREDG